MQRTVLPADADEVENAIDYATSLVDISQLPILMQILITTHLEAKARADSKRKILEYIHY